MQALSWDMWQFQTLLRDMIWGMPVGPFGPYGPNKMNEMYARKRYREHNAYVRGKMVEYERNGGVLKDKFLEYKVGEGWKPLCDFVGAKVRLFPNVTKVEISQEDHGKSFVSA